MNYVTRTIARSHLNKTSWNLTYNINKPIVQHVRSLVIIYLLDTYIIIIINFESCSDVESNLWLRENDDLFASEAISRHRFVSVSFEILSSVHHSRLQNCCQQKQKRKNKNNNKRTKFSFVGVIRVNITPQTGCLSAFVKHSYNSYNAYRLAYWTWKGCFTFCFCFFFIRARLRVRRVFRSLCK